MNRIITLALALVAGTVSILADTSPNGQEYDIKVGDLYFDTRNIGTTTRPNNVKMLVDADYIEHLVIPDQVDGMTVTHVADKAFSGRVDIESVTLNPGMKYLGTRTFENCRYISSIDLTSTENLNANRAFSNCVRIESVEIPTGLKDQSMFEGCTGIRKVVFRGIPDYVLFNNLTALTEVELIEGMTVTPSFSGCTALTSIKLPTSIEQIANWSFNNCTSLNELIIPENTKLTKIGSNAFSNTAIASITLPDAVTEINSSAFSGTPIKEFRLPLSLATNQSINMMFGDCANLQRITYHSMEQLMANPPSLYQYNGLGSTLSKSGRNIDIYIEDTPLEKITLTSNNDYNNAFSLIGTLTEVVIGNLTGSPSYSGAFYSCQSLETVEIGAGAPNLEHAFINCKNLRSVTVSEKNRTESLRQTFQGCESLESVRFSNVKTLYQAFDGCTAIKSIELPELTELSYATFRNCKSLEEISFPKLVTLAENTFERCVSLRRAYLPGCTTIERFCFKDCSALSDLTLGNVNAIPEGSFKNCESLSGFDFSNIVTIENEAFYNSGLTSVELTASTVLTNSSARIFDGSQKIKTFTATNVTYGSNGLSLGSLPALEECVINGDIPKFSLYNSMFAGPGTLTINGNVGSPTFGYDSQLKTIEFNGEITGESEFNELNLSEIKFRSIDDYLNMTFYKDRTPCRYNTTMAIDFYFGGVKADSLLIPAGTALKNYAFTGAKINKIVFLDGEGETSVGESAFAYCFNLKDVDFRGNVTSLGTNAFQATGLEKFVMSDCVKSLGMSCFQQCAHLKYIVFSSSLKHIPAGILHNCPQIDRIVIPEGVETLGDRLITYEWNPNIRLISLPSTLQKMYMGSDMCSFANIPTTVEVLCWSKTPPNSGAANFDKNIVHVPVGSAEAYRTHRQWMNANIIDDLLVDPETEVAKTEITIYVPVNIEVSDNARIDRYVVECMSLDENNEETYVGTYEFDASGNMMNFSRASTATTIPLKLTDLEGGTTYRYYVKGLTEAGDYIYSRKGTATTSTTSSLDAIGMVPDLTISGNILTINPDNAGQKISIYTIDGREVTTDIISDNGFTKELVNGIYVVTIGHKSHKIVVK